MPVSYHEGYDCFKKLIEMYQPEDLLDVGMGYGNIGSMAQIIMPRLELNGIEIWLPYLSHENSQAKRYKRIFLADIKDMIGKLWPVDIVVAWDVIEHLEREEGINVIYYLKSIAEKSLLISLPIIDYPQGAVYGNNAEIHKTQWKVEEMEELGAETVFKGKVIGVFEFKRSTTEREGNDHDRR